MSHLNIQCKRNRGREQRERSRGVVKDTIHVAKETRKSGGERGQRGGRKQGVKSKDICESLDTGIYCTYKYEGGGNIRQKCKAKDRHYGRERTIDRQSEVTRKERETSSETNEMKGRVTNKQRTGKVE